jgi:hypothetical protein
MSAVRLQINPVVIGSPATSKFNKMGCAMSTRSSNRLTTPTSGRSNGRSNGQLAGRANGRTNGHVVVVSGKNGGPAQRAPGQSKRPKRRVRVLPSVHLESKSRALLKSGASSGSDSLEVDYSGQDVLFRLSGRGIPLLEGAWKTAVSLDGRPIDCTGTWKAECWNADEDGDYLELKLEVGNLLRIERQLLLPRKGHLAIVADSIIGTTSARIDYCSTWPCAAKMRGAIDAATHTVTLRSKAVSARVYPLALPTERSHQTSDHLTPASRSLELAQQHTGKALFAPIVIDWSPTRQRPVPLWRRLTVSELRRPVAADVAAGFRLQVGREQWLIYHSLHNTGEARSVLGHNTWYETVIGSFGRDGTVDPLIQIE